MMKYLFQVTVFLCFALGLNAQIKTMNIEGKITKTPALLGESLMWDYRNNSLLWIDIEGKKLHQYVIETNKDFEIDLPKRPGTVVLTNNVDKCIVALEDTISEVSISEKKIKNISGPNYHGTPVRFNDGKCDPNGFLWIGTVDTKNYADPIAKLYKMERDNSFTIVLNDVTISNGICWSPDGRKMYYIDSPKRTVVAFDYDMKTSNISNPKTIIHTPAELGTPDGSCIDSEGMIWIAQWGGACVTRWNPQNGEIIANVEVPAKNVTSVGFGGNNLDILFITTAKIAMSPEEENVYPEAGHTFYIKPGVKGVKAYILKE